MLRLQRLCDAAEAGTAKQRASVALLRRLRFASEAYPGFITSTTEPYPLP
ncbi:MAG TPA: hypothetical protein PKH07_08610 [bacterium]|nr:hypothetical protein [bacterium]